MRWIWIDRVVELEAGRRMVAVKNVSLAEEHLHDHFCADEEREAVADGGCTGGARRALPVMPASLIIEGMAQTAGVLVGHASGFTQKVVLAKISRAELERDVGPGMTIRYTAEVERIDEMGASTRGTVEVMDVGRTGGVERGYEVIGRIDLLFSHLDHNMGAGGEAGASFPSHNFVFGEQIKTLLRTSGME